MCISDRFNATNEGYSSPAFLNYIKSGFYKYLLRSCWILNFVSLLKSHQAKIHEWGEIIEKLSKLCNVIFVNDIS